MAASHTQMIEDVLTVFFFLTNYFLQISLQQLVFVGAGNFQRLDSSRIDIRRQPVRGVGTQTVVEIQRDVGILLEEIERKVEIIVETVGGHARLFPVACLVHLKGRREILGIADHRDGNIAYEDTTLQGRLLIGIQPFELFFDGFRTLPVVDEQIGGQSVVLDTLFIGINGGACPVITLLVDDDGKTGGCLHRWLDDTLCRCGDGRGT